MRGKLVLLTGVAIGYVLGARAGRERYEEIKRAVGRCWNSPQVQHQMHNVSDFARDKAPDVVDYLSAGAKKVVQRKSSASSADSTKAEGGESTAEKTNSGPTPKSRKAPTKK